MIVAYNGNRYSFEVESIPSNGRFDFSITTTHKSTRRFSCINALNTILSEFDIEEDDPRAAASDWLLTKTEHRTFQRIAEVLFRNKNFLKLLESSLDEDRRIGEWANKRSPRRLAQ